MRSKSQQQVAISRIFSADQQMRQTAAEEISQVAGAAREMGAWQPPWKRRPVS